MILWIVGAFFGNFLFGCGVLAAIDGEDRELFDWCRSFPGAGLVSDLVYVALVSAWPAIAFVRWRMAKKMAGMG